MAMDTSMSAISRARPTGITITAWLWIVVGALMLFSAVMGGFAYSMMQQAGKPGMPGGGFPPEFAMMNLLFRNFGAVLAVQCAVALIAIWAGIDLLRLKAWARSAIEALSWVGVIWTLGFGIYWAYMWISMTGQMPKDAAPPGMDTFQVMGAVMGVVAMLMFAVPLVLMIRYLRGSEARGAITRAATTSG